MRNEPHRIATDALPDSQRIYAGYARQLIEGFGVRPNDPDRPIGTLSGGNVQRAVLARELSEPVKLLIVANPVFGLDFAATAAIHWRAAVLLVSEDPDEIAELADSILVMCEGRITYETDEAGADVAEIGRHMAGQGGHSMAVERHPAIAETA